MTSDRWQRAKEIFNSAVELSPDVREAYLAEACDGDLALHAEVEKLVNSYDTDFMETNNSEIGEAGGRLEGKTIGRYKVLQLLGVGGMGEVYLANDGQLGRKVAIKFLNERYESNASNVERFIQEAKAASALNHPNILTIHEIGETDGSHYIVSEYVDGHRLRTVMENDRPDLARTLNIAVQVAEALAAAHSARIVHRDLKPENIVIRKDGYAKVLDFGLAKLLPEPSSFIGLEDETVKQNRTAKGLILGTVNYMSPEQAKGEAVDARTDIFSLGVLIYEMITGRTPFTASSTSETFANLINRDPEPMSRYVSGVPDELQRIVSKMLRKDPDERYQTMKGLLVDLKDLQEHTSGKFDPISSPQQNQSTAVIEPTTGDTHRTTTEVESTSKPNRQRKWMIGFAAVAFLAIGAAVLVFLYAGRARATSISSVAVLPFASNAADPDTDLLGDGITDNIIDRLSELPGLTVTSHSAVFHYKDEQTDPQAVGNKLGVEAVLTGRLVKRNDSLMISFELVNVKDNSHVWGEQYDRKLSDLLPMQREISVDVANQLRPRLTGDIQRRLTREYTSNAEAYQLYLKGRHSWEKWSFDGSRQAVAFFKQALEKDPNYALAYAGLADAYIFGPGVGSNVPLSEAHRLARNAATRAISVDGQLGEAHAALAVVLWLEDWDFDGADREFKQALALSPSFAEGYHEYSHFLLNMGRINESLVETNRFLELDPVSEAPVGHLAYHYLYARQYDAAIQTFQKTFQFYDVEDPNSHVQWANAYYQKGMFREAVDEYLKGFAGAGTPANEINGLRNAFARSGIKGFLQEYIVQAKAEPEAEQDRAGIGEIYSRLGEKDQAFEWLEMAFAHHDDSLVRLKEELGYDNLRSDPRFADLLRRVGLPQ